MSAESTNAAESREDGYCPPNRHQHPYPEIKRLRLTDYKVRDLDSSDGTAARVRVLVETSNGQSTWGTVGVHQNIIEASWQALSEGITVGLLRAEATKSSESS